MKNHFVIYISLETVSLEMFWFSSYWSKCSWPIILQDSLKCNISWKSRGSEWPWSALTSKCWQYQDTNEVHAVTIIIDTRLKILAENNCNLKISIFQGNKLHWRSLTPIKFIFTCINSHEQGYSINDGFKTCNLYFHIFH